MSKMPAKKKSCFQITSVTTAQGAATSITDDTESLDDPDESRTEDVSSEIFDTSRATDYGPEEVCERSSSEETLNNVGDAETPGTVTPNILHDGPLAAGAVPVNGGATPRNPGLTSAGVITLPPQVGGAAVQGPAVVGANLQQQPVPSSAGITNVAPVITSQTTAPTITCSSRFRVIKLDHGSGEPFRRGRWTCMEFYDRDSDGSVIRSVDSIRHTIASTLDQATERDSGIGVTGGSVAPTTHSAQGPESSADISHAAVSQLHQTDINQPSQQQHFVIGHQPVGGAVGTSQPAYSPALANQQFIVHHPPQVQAHVNAQSVIQSGHNGTSMQPQNVTVAQSVMPLPQQQTSIPVTQPQQFGYSQSQIPPGHLMPSQLHIATGQTEYVQHVSVPQPQLAGLQATTGTIQNPATSSLPVDQVAIQGPPSVPVSSGALIIGVPHQVSEMVGPGVCTQTGIHQHVNLLQQGVGSGGVTQQQTMSPHQISSLQGVGSGMPSSGPSMAPGVQNVPAVVPSTGVASVSTSVPSVSTPLTMPNVPASLVLSQQSSQPSISMSTGVIQPVGLTVMQGSANPPPSLPQSNISQYPTQTLPGIGQIDESRKLEPLPPQPLVIAEGKPLMKPFIPDTFGAPLHLPATTPMNSLANSVFAAIPISIDGDEDSSSGASVVAIDNKIEQAMDLVKSHLMYAVREEVEVLKEQIKELVERNSMLERENALLKSLSNSEQLAQLPVQQANSSSTSQQQTAVVTQAPQPAQPPQQPNFSSA